ncbi:peptidase C12, ubiquitin carboxyl-terminal hydrolase 1 [Rhizopus microsporus ATCC 52813]|uniref:Ubiquitin carboxyl-terminal hydrolase n=1 Tax=Rhizopus microsporus ATCC 52813 TaxID=1340429 RepID=A0A2G4SJ06_RHIZD|nr:peptidase C12, ubiquitin carboxyl-terminal hydrolase 1 [Rhizopus microsporus ATCC 52813]PHZ08386.1 peptidase C12, ubiquitin carboxyl-terminal hydrolase 1 [Rhizopus microsporus ATCC 52813]
MEEENQEQRIEQKWVPLEANPEIWNKIIHKNGVDPRWNYVDVYGFDPELLAMIPRPVEAMIFLFPITEAYEKFKEEEEAHLIKCEQAISPDVVFFKQTIQNACGMIAILHSIASNDDELVGPGLFHDIIQEAKNMSIEERAELLENSKALAQVHSDAAAVGQTEAPDRETDVDLHFICFIEVDNHLYELDGRKLFPINHGKSNDLVESSVKIMKQYIARDPTQQNYSAIALCKTDDSS